ncbi:CG4813 [Drosophila busckii]|uniref:CG4813 n=1 Tax=Drosophila busckii TaxID=30019 RepID=A0A0M3QXK0_DROBS|nr:E3 ubiquitin-protein ligase Rnf220 [Drosophila busckii]ALC45999.1 CG4813 [Drosophila busckii]
MTTDTVPNADNFHLANTEEDVICPTCDAKIKRSQVADHCQLEVDRLHSMQLRSADTAPTTTTTTTTQATSTSTSTSQTQPQGQRKPWTVFQRVQRNRQARQRQRSRKRPITQQSTGSSASAPTSSQTAETSSSVCPVCNKSFPQAQIQEHANRCLRASRRNGQSNGEQQSSDEENDSDEYEEYEWAGQKRVRVSTLVQGGYAALNLGQTIKYTSGENGNDDNEDEEDLNVDEDDTHIYGPTQYNEGDVIPLANDAEDGDVSEVDVTSYMRSLISSSDVPKSQPNTNHSSEAAAAAAAEQTTEEVDDAAPSTSRGSSLAQNQQQIIESLKARLRLYEKQVQSKYKCLICIDDYKNPAISVSCWHVHCEQCWLQTLGARKLCPQCNSITTPKDLRRIYL